MSKSNETNPLERTVLLGRYLAQALVSIIGVTTQNWKHKHRHWNVLVSSWLYLVCVYTCSIGLFTFNKMTHALNSQEKPEWEN